MSNQSDVHAAVRVRSSTAGTWESDWLAMMAIDGFTTGPFGARQHDWLNAELVADGDTSAPYSSLSAAQTAYAIRVGVRRWTDLNDLL